MRFAKPTLLTLIILHIAVASATQPSRATANVQAPAVAVTASPSPVSIDATEVPAGRYKACVDAGLCHADTASTDSPCNYGNPARADHPMNCVSWTEADAYCRFAGERLC